MITEIKPEVDRSVSRRFGTVADERRVKRTAAALEEHGITVLRAADAAEANGSSSISSPMDRRCTTAPRRH